MTPNDLRVTPTHCGTGHKGSVWGIEGGLLWVIVGGAFVSLLVLLLCHVVLQIRLGWTLFWSALPVLASVAYVLFKQSSPPGYDVDLIDYWLHGPGFGPNEPAPEEEPRMPTIRRLGGSCDQTVDDSRGR